MFHRKTSSHFVIPRTKQLFSALAICMTFSNALASPEDPKSSQKYLRRAELLMKQGKADDAISQLDRYLSWNAGDVYAWMTRSKCNLSLKRPKAALADLSRAIEANPRAWWVYNDRGRVYLRTGDYKRAQTDFNRVLSLAPVTKKTYILRANARAHTGDFRGAVSDFQRALALSTGGYKVTDDLKVDLARCLSDARADAMSKTGERDARIALAIAELSTGEFRKSAQMLESAHKVKLLPPFALVLLSNAQFLANQRDRALKAAGDALDAAPTDELCVMALPDLYYRIGTIDRAADDLKKRISRHPESALLHVALGQVLDLLDDSAGAMQQMEQAIKLDGRLSCAFVKRAQLHLAAGKRKEAVSDFSKALSLNKMDYDTLLNRARCYFEMNDLPRALADLNLVVKAEYNLSRALSARAQCYARMGKASEAARDRQQVHEAGD